MTKQFFSNVLIVIGGLFLVFFLSQVFSGRVILPQTFSLGPLTVHYYGLTMAGAVLAGFLLAKKRARFYQIEEKQAEDLMFWLIIGGFAGARLYHVLTGFDFYRQNPIDIFKVWQGGLGIYGALIGGLISLVALKKILNLKSSILNLLDWLAPSVILGQIIGRFGNFFNYELYGYPTNLPWQMFAPAQFRPEAYLNSNFFHPLFLYEALGNLVILIFLLKFFHPHPTYPLKGEEFTAESGVIPSPRGGGLGRGDGTLFFSYLLLYNVLRFSIEFLKIDSQLIGPFRLNNVISLVLILFSIAALWRLNYRWKNTTNTFQ